MNFDMPTITEALKDAGNNQVKVAYQLIKDGSQSFEEHSEYFLPC